MEARRSVGKAIDTVQHLPAHWGDTLSTAGLHPPTPACSVQFPSSHSSRQAVNSSLTKQSMKNRARSVYFFNFFLWGKQGVVRLQIHVFISVGTG